jgi:glycerol-3-phosphate cytidylyltransferase
MIGFTCGAWDLLHPGHLHFLMKCNEQCNQLVIGLHTNPNIDRPTKKSIPIQTTFERYLQLKSCSYISDIIPYDTEKDLENMMSILNMDIRFLGSDYKNKPYTGEHICLARGIKIVYIDRLHSYSSSELRVRLNK